jgi:DNA-binding HxlR family transcriptional regulator
LHYPYVYKGNYLSSQEKLGKVSVVMETIGKRYERTKAVPTKLSLIQNEQSCDFNGYDADMLMKETAKLRKLITKKGTFEILIPLCCTTNPVRYIKFRHALKGFSSKTLAARLKELQKSGILERQSYNETPPRVEYNLTDKGQELVESIIGLLQWMRKWSSTK